MLEYVHLGLSIILFISMIVLFAIIFSVNSRLRQRIDDLTASTNATSSSKPRITFFDHVEFDKLDPAVKQLLITHISNGFMSTFMDALNTYIKDNNQIDELTTQLKQMSGLKKDDILAFFRMVPSKSKVKEKFTNSLRNLFD